MTTEITSNESKRTTIQLTLSDDMLEDLHRLASFNEITIEELMRSYLANGIEDHSRIVRRMEFENHLNDNLGKKIPKKDIGKEIRRDSSFLY